MIKIGTINGQPISYYESAGKVTFMGMEFLDTEVTDYNVWNVQAVAPTLLPLNHYGYTPLELKFLIEPGTPAIYGEQLLENQLNDLTSALAGGRTDITFTNGVYTQYNYSGTLSNVATKRINRSMAVEVTYTLRGMKYKLTPSLTPTPSGAYKISTALPSPLIIEFSVTGAGAGDSVFVFKVNGVEAFKFSNPSVGNYRLDGFEHSIVDTYYASRIVVGHMSKLYFPKTEGFGKELSLTVERTVGTGTLTIDSVYAYERLI